MTRQFERPDDIYYGTDFWMLNDNLSEDEIYFQMDEMYNKGTKAILVRTYSGLVSDYPGQEYKRFMKIIVDYATKLGMQVYLQAKYMPECVEELPEKYAMRHLVAKKSDEVTSDDCILSKYDDFSICVVVKNTIVDLFNEESADYYIKDSYEDMWSDFRQYFGNTVPSIWVDEPSVGRGNLPWPKDFKILFKKRWGYDIRPHLYKLWVEKDDYKKIRYQCRLLLQELLEDCYFKRLKKWCDKNNLKFSGHLLGEDNLKLQIRWSVACMPYYKYFDVPGIDILTVHMEWKDEPVKQKPGDELRDIQRLYTTPVQIMSAVKQAGNDDHVLCEMFGASTENMTFRNQKHLFDHLASFGINHRSVHGIFYSLRGRRKRGYAPHIGYYQPYWYKYKDMYDYCARVSSFVRFGNTIPGLLVIHPLETCYTIINQSLPNGVDDSKIDDYDRRYFNMILNLTTSHINYDLGDFATLRDLGNVEGDFLKVGKEKYRAVLLPEIDVLSIPVFKLLKDFSDNGGRVMCIGNPPTTLDGESYDFTDEINFTLCDNLSKALDVFKSDFCDYCLEGTDDAIHVLVNHRIDENADFFMLTNTDCVHEKHLKLTVSGERNVKIWNAQNGTIEEASASFSDNGTCYAFCLNAGNSILLSFEKGKNVEKPDNNYLIDCIISDKEWNIQRDTDNVLLLEYCRYKTNDNDEYSNEMPVLAVNELLYNQQYSGKLYMEFGFETDHSIYGLKLVLEDIENSKIYYNGEYVEPEVVGYYVDKNFVSIRLPGKCKVGKNVITVVKNYIPLCGIKSDLSSIFQTSSGTELECMYLTGNFAVKSTSEHCLNGCVKLNRNFVLTKEKGFMKGNNLTVEGYPFYSGCVNMSRSYSVDNINDCVSAKISIDSLRAGVAEVFVNGHNIGTVFRGPVELECKKFLNNGENLVCVKIASTLRNLFGPSHRQIGERGNTFTDTTSRSRGCYGYFDEPWIPMDTMVVDWEKKIDTETPVWSPSYFLLSLGAEDVKLNLYYYKDNVFGNRG